MEQKSRESRFGPSPIELLKSLLKNYFLAIFLAAITAFLLRIFVIEAFRIPSDFMSPALLSGDHLFLNKLAYKTSPIHRGDIVVFSFPNDPSKDFIKRVVAVAGDTIELKEGVLWINGKLISKLIFQTGNNQSSSATLPLTYEETLPGLNWYYLAHWDSSQESQRNMIPLQVPSGNIFVLGDQRSKGQDSRFWGFLPTSSVKGRAAWIWFSRSTDNVRWSRIFTKVK